MDLPATLTHITNCHYATQSFGDSAH